MKPGEVCRRYVPGVAAYEPCKICEHLWVLHTRDGRGCAGCEAIAEAMKVAREQVAPWLGMFKDEGGAE